MELEFSVGTRSVVLTDYGHLLAGRLGDLAPEMVLETRSLGGGLGITSYRSGKRALDIPFFMKASTITALLNNVRTMLNVLTLGEGTLRATREDGIIRELQQCYFKNGLREKSWKTAETILSFDALDPYWYDPISKLVEFTLQPASASFFPLLPLHLLASSIFEEATVNNPGMETWPVWTIYGPGDGVSLVNNTSGRSLYYSGNLSSSDVLVIDTTPGIKTVKLNGSNAWSAMAMYSADLWPLEMGDNIITTTLGSATSVSKVELAYFERYISL